MISTDSLPIVKIGVFGRKNIGKSSFINMIFGEEVLPVDAAAGTTKFPVEKTINLSLLGNAQFLDTVGIDDKLGVEQLLDGAFTKLVDQIDIMVILTRNEQWAEYEEVMLHEAKKRNTPCLIVVNQIDIAPPSEDFLQSIEKRANAVILCSCADKATFEQQVSDFKKQLIRLCPHEYFELPSVLEGVIERGGLVILVTDDTLDTGRNSLMDAHIHTLRDAMEQHAVTLVTKKSDYPDAIGKLCTIPSLVVCDSVVLPDIADATPSNVPLSTFSILLARSKGNFAVFAEGAAAVTNLKSGDKVLLAETCGEHFPGAHIGREQIPKWISEHVAQGVQFDIFAEQGLPKNIAEYKLIIQCSGCVISRRDMLYRIQCAHEAGVPITSYGFCIAAIFGKLERVLTLFTEKTKA